MKAEYPVLPSGTLSDRCEEWDKARRARVDLPEMPSVAASPVETARIWLDLISAGVHVDFPWKPLVEAHVESGVKTLEQVESRDDPIVPSSIIISRNVARQGTLFGTPSYLARNSTGRLMYVEGWSEQHVENSLLRPPQYPVLPLQLYDLGVSQVKGADGKKVEKRGRGAPLALRIFLEAVFSVPLDERPGKNDLPRGMYLPPITLRDFLVMIYGEKANLYRPATHWHRIREALHVLGSSEARIPITTGVDSKGRRMGMDWQVVNPVGIPTHGYMDETVVFRVNMPPGSHNGPLVDRPKLREAGRVSAPLYRLNLSLAAYWWDPGRLRFPVGRGKNRKWVQSKQADRYPPVTDADLVAMCFPTGDMSVLTKTTAAGQRLNRARKALSQAIESGLCVRAANGAILPGTSWAGWAPGAESDLSVE